MGRQVRIQLRARRFFCDAGECETRIFTERFPAFCRFHGRRTDRAERWLLTLMPHMSAVALERLVHGRHRISDSSLLRLFKRAHSGMPLSPLRIIGIDDWAGKKGERYGTITCDLESHRPVALLSGRDVQTVSKWISRHPAIQVVARDGSFEFREAFRIADEDILQVSDRWHLFHHPGKKVEEILKRHLPAVLRISLPGKKQGEQERVLSPAESRKWELIQRVQNDSREGVPLNVLARRYHLDPKTCRRYLAMSGPPSNRGWHRPHSAERFRREVERWVREGRTSEWMHRQLKGLGCTIEPSAHSVRSSSN